MDKIKEINEVLNKKVKCPFGKCSACEKKMNPDECAINHINTIARASIHAWLLWMESKRKHGT
jgi:hypothetical protein